MKKEKRMITRYGLEIPEYRGTPRLVKVLRVLVVLGVIITGFVFFIRWISDDSIDYEGQITTIESPTPTRTPRPTLAPSPTPVPTPRILMSEVLGDAYSKYQNVAGLVYINGTSISETVFQGDDNQYYFTHNALGQQDPSGEVFIDSKYPVHELKESANIVLYGTLMPNNLKFGGLESYASNRYFEQNNKIVLETLYATYEFEIFAYYKPGDDGFEYDRTEFEDQFDFEDYVKACKDQSEHETEYTPYKKDTILTLAAVEPGGQKAAVVVQAYFKQKLVD